MNRFNPFYILVFSALIFSYSIFLLENENNDLIVATKDNKEFVNLANRYNTLQRTWGDNTKTLKKIENIIKQSKIKNANIISNDKTIKITIKNASLKSMDKFVNKVFNESIEVLNFSLTKKSLDMEVGY